MHFVNHLIVRERVVMKLLMTSVSCAALICATPVLAELTAADVAARFETMMQMTDVNVRYDLTVLDDGSIALSNIEIVEDRTHAVLRQTEGTIRFAPVSGDYEVAVLGLEKLAFQMLDQGAELGEFSIESDGYTYQLRGAPDLIESTYSADDISILGEISSDVGDMSLAMIYKGILSKGVSNYGDSTGHSDIQIASISTETTTRVGHDQPISNSVSTSEDNRYQVSWSGIPFARRFSEFQAGVAPLISPEDSLSMVGTSGLARSINRSTTMDGESVVADILLDASAFSSELANGTFAVQYSMDAMNLKLAGSAMPFPKATLGVAGFDTAISIPLTQNKNISEGAFRMDMSGITFSDSVWNLFDPTRDLPRVPMDMVVDLGIGVQFSEGLFLYEGLSESGSEAPLTLETLDINEVSLSALGLDFAASGQMVFDNSTAEPRPEGAIDAQVSGANQLLNALSEIGLLQPEMVMGARMMMGLMLVPTNAPDSFTSRIEVGADGVVTANGVPLQ